MYGTLSATIQLAAQDRCVTCAVAARILPFVVTGDRRASVDWLFEREGELARVDVVLERASSGAGAVLVLEGPAGIGKSELLAAIRGRSEERGFGLLKARGSEFEAEMAFGVACQLLEPMLRSASAAERRRLLQGVARVGARVLGVEAGEPPADRFAAIHGLYWLCAARAERGPIVVAVDDAQWVDDPSLAWLGYLARRAPDLGVVLVLALRSGDPGARRDELDRLLRDDEVERIVLGPLSAAGVEGIVRARMDPDADQRFCAVCSELTGGNALFVCELLAAAVAEGLPARAESLASIAPAAVGTSVLGRLGRMGSEAAALARAVAVLGAGAEVQSAAELAELDPTLAEVTADRLAAAQIFAAVRPLEFFHPLIGAAVREDMAPGARRLAHRRAAELLARDGSTSRIAVHLLACAPSGDGWVVQRLCDAAREALDHAAADVSVGYLQRALAEPPPPDQRASVLLLLGNAEWRAHGPDAIAHLEDALRVAEAEADGGTAIATCIQLGVAYFVSDRTLDAVAVLERALASVDAEPSAVALTIESGAALLGMMDDRTGPEALRRAESLRGRPGLIADLPLYTLVTLCNHAARTGRADEAERLAELALGREPYPPPLEIAVGLIAPLILIESYDRASRLCEDLMTVGRHRGAMQEMAGISALRASASANRGALADAEADARWAFERAEGVYRLQAGSETVRILVERDALDEAEHELQRLGDRLGSHSVEVARLLMARGRLRYAQGRIEEALADFLECGRRCLPLGLVTIAGSAWRSEAALAHAALGDGDEARRLADELTRVRAEHAAAAETARAAETALDELRVDAERASAALAKERAREFGRPRMLGVSLRAYGLVHGGEAGFVLLREAVETLERSQSPLELARALSDNGAALRRRGQRVQARSQLERGLDLAHHCGARRIAAYARAELIAAGAKPRRDAITGRDALTAGELRVARLAADGLTNREIAQALFITTKTASAHLSHVYRKLGISRRAQLAGALAGHLTDHGAADHSAVTAAIS